MRIFKHGNWKNRSVCPICKTNKKGEVVLIAIEGTNSKESYNFQALQFHLSCIELFYNPKVKVIYQRVNGEVEQIAI